MKPIPEMTRDEINRELCERLGLQWHETDCTTIVSGTLACKCGVINCGKINPDFYSDPGKVPLLREMAKRADNAKFKLFLWKKAGWLIFTGTELLSGLILGIPYSYLYDPDGLFAITALEFLRKEQG